MNRKKVCIQIYLGSAALVVGGVGLTVAVAGASLRYLHGYSYSSTNDAPGIGYDVKLLRFPIDDSTPLITGIGPTDGLYIFDLSDLPGRPVALGDSLLTVSYNRANPNQRVSLVRVVDDTVTHNMHAPSGAMHDTAQSGLPFNACGNVKDTLKGGTLGIPLMVASWLDADTTYDSIPHIRGNDQYDSLRVSADGAKEGAALHFRIYRGGDLDTVSMYTDTSIVVNRQFGRFENDVAWIRNPMVFPKTVAGVQERRSPAPEQEPRMMTPCRAKDLQAFVERNHGKVEVIDVSGGRWMRGDFSSLPSGVYLLRFSQEPKHTEEIVLQRN